MKLIKCPSAPTGDWFPDPVDAKAPYTHGGHCTQRMQSLKHLRFNVSAVLLHSIAQGTRTRTKLHIQYRDFKTCHQELGESTDVEPSHKSLLSLFLHTLINVNMLQ